MGVEMFQLRWVYVVHESNFFSLFKLHTIQKPFGYVGVLQEESVEPSDGQRNVLNQLKDWDLWYVTVSCRWCLSLSFETQPLLPFPPSSTTNLCLEQLNNTHSTHKTIHNRINSITNNYHRGPLFICLSLALILSTKAPAKQTSHVFTTVFIVMWIGSLVVTINAQLLGATMSIFQSLCVLGYCVFPLTVSALVIAILEHTWFGTLWLDFIWLALGFVWATRVSSIFVGQFVKRKRRFLALYPVFFFYLLLGWLILLF